MGEVLGKMGITQEGEDDMGKVKLATQQPNYLERPVADPDRDMKRAQQIVREDRRRRARFLITSTAR